MNNGKGLIYPRTETCFQNLSEDALFVYETNNQINDGKKNFFFLFCQKA